MDTREYWSGSDIVFNCLVDNKRVLALRNAIRKIVKKDDVVADLGTGSGILAMFAADAGAKKVYAVEADENLYKTLETNFQINGHQKTIQLVKGDVRKIKLPEKMDVVICEMVATGLIDEIQVLAMNRFLKFTKKSTKIIPSAMRNYVDLVFNNNSFYGHKLNVVRYEYVYDKKLKSKPFSNKFLYSEVDFRKLNGIKIDKEIPMVINKSGVINGIRITNQTLFPDGSKFGDSLAYCIPLILPIRETAVKKGDQFLLNLSYKIGSGLKDLKYLLRRKEFAAGVKIQ